MRRDMGLIRQLLLNLEAYPQKIGGTEFIRPDDAKIMVPGFDFLTVAYHLRLIKEAGLIDSGGAEPVVGIGFRSLTWEGHDYLDSVRDPEVWRKTEGVLSEAGGFTIDMAKSLAKGFLKVQIKQRTGIDLDI